MNQMVDGDLIVRTTHLKDGYFKARSRDGENKLSIGKDDPDKILLSYDISKDYKIYPLQYGNGKYFLKLWKRTTDGSGKYRRIGGVGLDVRIGNQFSPYLHSNVFVNCKSVDDIIKEEWKKVNKPEAFRMVKGYFLDTFCYDFIKSVTVKNGAMPDIFTTLNKHMGISQDLSAIAVAIFRRLKIPSKLVYGKLGEMSHAWTEVYISGKWVLFDPTILVQRQKDRNVKDYKKERWF